MYKKASRLKLKFNTPRGYLTTEQLWDLSFKDLVTSIKQAKSLLEENSSDDDLDFLEESSSEDNTTYELEFNILKDVYLTKRKEKDALNEASRNKEHNEKIMALIHKKEEESLQELSTEQLKEMLK